MTSYTIESIKETAIQWRERKLAFEKAHQSRLLKRLQEAPRWRLAESQALYNKQTTVVTQIEREMAGLKAESGVESVDQIGEALHSVLEELKELERGLPRSESSPEWAVKALVEYKKKIAIVHAELTSIWGNNRIGFVSYMKDAKRFKAICKNL